MSKDSTPMPGAAQAACQCEGVTAGTVYFCGVHDVPRDDGTYSLRPQAGPSSGPEPKTRGEWIEECALVCDSEARRLRGAGVYEARAQTAWECARLIRLLLGRKT